MTERVPMTPKGAAKAREELARLKAERPKISRDIGTARDHGDISENAEYHAAKERQGMVEAQIKDLEDKLARSEVIDPSRLSGPRIRFGATVSLDSGDSLKGRIGVALNHDAGSAESRSHVYGIANLTYEFLDGTAVDVAGVNVAFEPDAFGAELGLGGAYEWAGGKYALYGEALAQSSFEGSYGVKGTVGFSTTF